ncbi:MAG: acyl CoA--acetate/3-ketoacid CoA transferase subunit beta, partial [Deltaproteobacteria bacterium]|nr:acyl CoA--acetate/3-ketoacid CoA transferase subunit beta [Deltaproteobacteria bacterium]
GRTMEDRIARIRRECGWDLSISGNVTEIPPPTMKELSLLNRLDPEGLFLKR